MDALVGAEWSWSLFSFFQQILGLTLEQSWEGTGEIWCQEVDTGGQRRHS